MLLLMLVWWGDVRIGATDGTRFGFGLDAIGDDEVIGALDSPAMLATAGCSSGALASVLMSAAGGKLPLAVSVFTVLLSAGSSLVSALSLSLPLSLSPLLLPPPPRFLSPAVARIAFSAVAAVAAASLLLLPLLLRRAPLPLRLLLLPPPLHLLPLPPLPQLLWLL